MYSSKPFLLLFLFCRRKREELIIPKSNNYMSEAACILEWISFNYTYPTTV